MNTPVVTEHIDLLLVEDQPSDAELTLRALRDLDLAKHFHRIGDGAQALDFLFGRAAHADRSVEDAPGLILLDLKLPKVSGHEVLRALKSDERTRHIPVVVLSSSGERSDVERCYALGANSYVVKPVDFDAFTNTVQRIGTYWLQMNETYGA
ncbi:response regulator [Salinibacter ruber]|uniref:response regulator n=1 Tax=Salinibacter ruber TaxID=146919 RepID=UPI002168C7C1|nr:response regulator [Salinibacter ruber]MCS3698700.1 CheY-like chemotaxis protein [Salinibacter ruber]MCS4040541.1 CheY-like chemotaxis protein [Salinibacter ruber]